MVVMNTTFCGLLSSPRLTFTTQNMPLVVCHFAVISKTQVLSHTNYHMVASYVQCSDECVYKIILWMNVHDIRDGNIKFSFPNGCG